MDNCTESYAMVIARATEVRDTYKLNYIGTEHLMYGILSLMKINSCIILNEMGLDILLYKPYFLDVINKDKNIHDYTPRAKAALENAKRIAIESELDYVSDLHLLLAILYINDCRAMSILRKMGVDIGALKKKVLVATGFKRSNRTNVDDEETKKEPPKDNKVTPINPIPQPPRVEKKEEYEVKSPISPKQNELVEEEKPKIKEVPQKRKKKIDTKVLDSIGYDLTEKARIGKLGPVIGRDDETARVIQILSRKTKNNPVLVGEAGVGKTAVVEGLAMRIVEGNVPEMLKDRIIFCIELGSLVAGTKYRGDMEQRLEDAIRFAEQNDIILYIDEIHNIVGAGSSTGGAPDAAELLKPVLARGEISLIGSTTLKEYTKYIEKDSALERRFQPVFVEEPSIENAILILKGLKSSFEAHHHVRILDNALEAAVKLSDRYISNRFLPDKAIDVIDEASSQKHIQVSFNPDSLMELEQKLVKLQNEAQFALDQKDAKRFKEINYTIGALKKEISLKKDEIDDLRSETDEVVTIKDVKRIISVWTKIPINDLSEDDKTKLLNLDKIFKSRVIGQDKAVDSVVRAIKRSSAKLNSPNKPIGSFLFVGPTGVGKTELAKEIARSYFNNKDAFIRFDLNEFTEKNSVSKLIGTAPGYVGYEEEGQLTEMVRNNPFAVVLFDELEKASSDIYDLFLNLLDEGRIKDSKGRVVDFKNTIIIMTSNIGFAEKENRNTLGFGAGQYDVDRKVHDELSKHFRSEFLNRIDEIVVFNKLSKSDCNKITKILLQNLGERFEMQGIKVHFDDSIVSFITERGYSEQYGARPIERTIKRYIEDKFSEEIILGNVNPGDFISIYVGLNGVEYSKA